MTGTLIELTEDEFDARYTLIPNHINPSATWAIGDAGGCLFGTSGAEFELIRRYDPRKVWTLVDGDDGDLYVVSGLHYVNRVGYLLSREPVPEDTAIQVRIPMGTDEESST
jgi:hypothetical protein